MVFVDLIKIIIMEINSKDLHFYYFKYICIFLFMANAILLGLFNINTDSYCLLDYTVLFYTTPISIFFIISYFFKYRRISKSLHKQALENKNNFRFYEDELEWVCYYNKINFENLISLANKHRMYYHNNTEYSFQSVYYFIYSKDYVYLLDKMKKPS